VGVVPPATTDKVAIEPLQMVVLEGFVVIEIGVFSVNVTVSVEMLWSSSA
jgi:hypothetical protein